MFAKTCMICSVVLCVASVSAMPSRSELKKVQGTVNELMADDLAAMKAGRMKPEDVARSAERFAQEATDECSKFLFYKGAFGLYVQGKAYDEAIRTIDTLTKEVKDVPDKVLADIIRDKLKRIPRKDGGAIFDLYERIDRRQRSAEEIAGLEKKLKESPSDKSLRQQLAVKLAQAEKWDAALKAFAELGGKEAEAAKAEKSDPAAAADFWWTYQADEEGSDVFRAHAAELYRTAIAGGKLTGIRLALAKKRTAEFAPEGGTRSASARVASDAEQPERARQSAPLPEKAAEPPKSQETDAVQAAPNGKYDWSIPKKLKGVKTLDFDLGTTEKLTLFAVPSGEGKWYVGFGKPMSFRVTRPFWIAQFPLTLDQTRSLIKGRDLSFTEPLAEACEGDRTVLAAAGLLHDDITEFFEKMNAKFGHLLPKGWVFRPPTCAEVNVVRGLPFVVGGEGNNQAALLPVLQAKGFYNDCTDANKVRVRCEADGRWVDPGLLLLGADKIRAKKQLKLSGRFVEKEACLDMVSTPDVKEWPGYDRKVCEAVGPILKAGFRAENPFWYCEEDAPNLRNGDGDLTFYLRNSKPYFVIRVVVGYDYVGEWKTKNGK